MLLLLSDEEDDVDGVTRVKSVRTGPRCERTFITFENDIDETVFESVFPSKKRVRDKGGYICAITKLPAKYFDPITQLPYRDIQAFKILREAYYQQLDEQGNAENPAVAKWLQWRKKVWTFIFLLSKM